MGTSGQGSLLGGRYLLLRELSKGGMGTVWKAEDQKLKREVAVKLMAERYSQKLKALDRFEREAMSVARLRSPHIVEVYDYGADDGRPYMVMELLVGEDLRRRLKRERRLPVELVVRLAIHLGKALATAHADGVVHRDLKPGNIFLVRDHDQDLAKVFDFGIAKALHGVESKRELTTDGSLLGTPHYMSPEQLRGDGGIDLRADLWSVAVILYRALTGKRPFEGPDIGELVRAILDDVPPPPSQIVSEAPAALDRFFARALDKDPAARHGDAREMAEAFIQAASSMSDAPPPPFSEVGEDRRDHPLATTGNSDTFPSTDRISVNTSSTIMARSALAVSMGGPGNGKRQRLLAGVAALALLGAGGLLAFHYLANPSARDPGHAQAAEPPTDPAEAATPPAVPPPPPAEAPATVPTTEPPAAGAPAVPTPGASAPPPPLAPTIPHANLTPPGGASATPTTPPPAPGKPGKPGDSDLFNKPW